MIMILELVKMVMKATVSNSAIRQHLKRSMFGGKCFGQYAQVIRRAKSPFPLCVTAHVFISHLEIYPSRIKQFYLKPPIL